MNEQKKDSVWFESLKTSFHGRKLTGKWSTFRFSKLNHYYFSNSCYTLRFDNCFTSLLNIIDGRKSLQVILRRLVLIFSYMYSWYFSGEEDDKEKTCDVVIFFYSFEKEKETETELEKKIEKEAFLEWNFLKFFHKKFLEKTDFF